ncbi:ATP-dependent protease LonB [Candidatus Woesearchaeota archaeon]|nr:ATP-dependent protease LonB [Candidatus Woesearchaeota archaeon]
MGFNFKTTAEIKVPKKIAEQVIGQEHGLEIIKKAANHRRHVMLIGEPGTGKSMLGLALAELLSTNGKLQDVLCYPNEKDANNPKVKIFPASEGEKSLLRLRKSLETGITSRRLVLFLFAAIFIFITGWFLWSAFGQTEYGPIVMVSAIGNMIWILLLAGFLMARAPGFLKSVSGLAMLPKPVITHKKKEKAPFIDATGAHAGALLGDVLHDPLQSGGLGTPPHERVMPGMIHRASGGVLFVDEIANLKIESQQELLTALQEKKYPITGQSEKSSGSMVRTEPVPCDFVLVAAGNLETLKHMHPALRSRIRGYGYEVFMKETMDDTEKNQEHIAKFVAQEVVKDGKIPHFSKTAVMVILDQARKLANRKNQITLRFRELGGLIRAAGDVALTENAKLVEPKHIFKALKVAKTLEQQMADTFVERKKEYEIIITKGTSIGRVNGLAVMGGGGNFTGILLPIESEVTPGGKEKGVVATGKLGTIAQEAVKNVTAIVKKFFGEDIKDYDIYVQFLQTYEGVEGDSASIAVATSIISALKQIPVRQDTAMTGSLSVRGEVLPIGGVTAKVEAAIDSGIKQVLVPKNNVQDIIIHPDILKKIKVTPVSSIKDVLKHALDFTGKEDLKKKILQTND